MVKFGESPRELPKVMIGGKEYYKDDRLREYRNVDNPHDVIPFEEKNEADDIQHWKCSSCGKVLTYIKEEDRDFGIVSHITHFDIERSRKDLWLDLGEIEEVIEKRNLKMQRFLCEDCFLNVLRESPTLGKLFFIKAFDKFIY